MVDLAEKAALGGTTLREDGLFELFELFGELGENVECRFKSRSASETRTGSVVLWWKEDEDGGGGIVVGLKDWF